MSKKEKPLPIPLNSPLGRKRGFMQNEEGEPLMADQIAKAMAEGKLEEFLQREIPDNEYARKLTMMMLEMTGMLPSEGLPSAPEKEPEKPSTTQPPEDVTNAVKSGNVKELMGLLERKYKKRTPDAEISLTEEKTDNPPDMTIDEKETIDQLIKIASENNVTLDWVISRALRVYVQEYLKTGRM